MLENMGFRVVDERTYRIEPATPGEPDVWFHDMVLERADGGAVDLASRKQRARGLLPRGDDRRRRERRLQRARARRRPRLARCRADPHDLALPAPDPRALFAGLHVGDAGQACRHRGRDRARCSMPASIRALDIAIEERKAREAEIARRHRGGAANGRRASTRTASCATSSTPCRRRCAPISTSSTATAGRKR